ncbi:hypothetical protein GobsT_14420 [Gemmata obscuriglobus]|uniref:Uncharacterized protein n=1 Tax=Gemmata obscuriglobus TaxID=114 RepID=A0A2Z3HFI6_9BACT|nr:hypothetical protein [Gemmata obscuriglobus]AWM40130.1 hypothetical protein C1280_26075 [Gemmata obscuriglobus]QEG26697.1 hypothetical protein GobsT_14420 [Gemmata obscuriglobus]VTS02380.1 unnamed protein product [Gemmata obscuriglobus UQM 2246]
MRTREITVFSTSFLDLLSCGLGAVILLCLVFAASKMSQGRVKGETTLIRVRVVPHTGSAPPKLGVYVELGDVGCRLSAGEPPLAVGGVKLSIIPQDLGANEYTVVLTGERFDRTHRVGVYIHDYADAPRQGIDVEVERYGKGASTKDKVQLKPGEAAHRSFTLEGVESDTYSFRWE